MGDEDKKQLQEKMISLKAEMEKLAVSMTELGLEPDTGLPKNDWIKPPKYKQGENFNTFCDRFEDYVKHTKRGKNLDTLFLQCVDNVSYPTLKSLIDGLSTETKNKVSLLCRELKTGFSGGEIQTVKQQLMSLKQSSTESITSFCANIEEKARLAYGNMKDADDIALLVLLRGLRNREILQKLNEASLTSYEEGMRLALKLETVNNLINGESSTDVLQAGEAQENSFSSGSQDRWRSNERYRENSSGRYNSRRVDWSDNQFRCYNCGKSGHLARNCYSNRRNNLN